MFVVFKIIGMVLFSPASADIYASFGLSHASHSVMIGISLIGMLMEPLSTIMERGMTCLTRCFEFQADAFAVDLGRAEGLKHGLISLSEENKSSLNDDWLWAWYHLDHPSLVERVRAIDNKVENDTSKASETKKTK